MQKRIGILCTLALAPLAPALWAPSALAGPTKVSNLGVSVGPAASGLPAFVAWCRRPDYIWINTDHTSWRAGLYSLAGQLDPKGLGLATQKIPAIWTVPMIVTGASLADAASGRFKPQWLAMARKLAAYYGANYPIILRPANEFNGTWMPWTVRPGQEATFVRAWRAYADTWRSVFPNARFDWNVQLFWDSGTDVAAAYPGDAYVSFIGGDLYYNPAGGHPRDPAVFWRRIKTHKVGLDWLEAFAAAHRKPITFTEWGLNTDAPLLIDNLAGWFADHKVAIQIYWFRNDDPQNADRLTNRGMARAAAAYRKAFCAI